MSEGRCRAVGCDIEIPPDRDWYRRHWRMVPKRLQTLLYHHRDSAQRERVLTEARAIVERLEFGERLL